MQLHVEERAKGHIQVKSHVPQKAEANKKRLGPFDEGIPTIISAIGWQQRRCGYTSLHQKGENRAPLFNSVQTLKSDHY